MSIITQFLSPPVRPGVEVQHCAGVVQDLGHARPHDHPEVDPLRPRLRGGEVNPTSKTHSGVSFKNDNEPASTAENWGISMLETNTSNEVDLKLAAN